MKRQIAKAFLTLLETGLIWVFVSMLLWKKFPIFHGLAWGKPLFFLALASILFLKYLMAKFGRFRILHFSMGKVDRMAGEEFEEFLKSHFEYLGCRVTMTKASGDYGADLILNYKGRIIAVQAKRYQSSIGVKAIQEVIGSMAYYKADVGLVVTNSSYTKNAVKLALANGVILWDRDILTRMMNRENMSGYLSEFL